MCKLPGAISRLAVGLVFAFLPAPIIIVVLSSFSPTGYLTFPPQGFSLRWYSEFLSSGAWLYALGVSALLAIIVALFTTLLSLMAGLATTRLRIKGQAAFGLLMLSPLLFPHAAIAVALLGVASFADAVGTYGAIFLAHAVLCMPFAYRPLLTSMRKLDLAMEEAAMMLGARPWQVFSMVTLPMLRPGIVTALLFSFIISFDEVTVTVFLLGPKVTTLPTQIFSHIQESASPVIAAISAFLVLLTLGIVALLNKLVGLELFIETER
ncbi:ABC transporter permease [Bordetella pseudohinzii]|uniref:ABC transporter permease n=1 Tax=Bordetella pseudohinzii TaxID=1331258 RepID=A0ABM6DKJ1_9BORD|nr:ABC transporter permease [Bordetella pseudohinzii]